MSHNPQWEDYRRMGLRFALSLDEADAASATRSFASFGRRFAQDRDSLPQTDAERAFHLVALVANMVDQELPISSDERAEQILSDGHRMLEEALALDPYCFDAMRMLAMADCPHFEAAFQYLNEHADEVRVHCEEEAERAQNTLSSERAKLATELAWYPYYRWAASQAGHALICGHNRQAISLADALLELDVRDTCDVRFTAAYAFAKLEDADGLDAFNTKWDAVRRRRLGCDPWLSIARMALAYRRRDITAARRWLETILRAFRGAEEVLFRQVEFPEAVFARLAVAPGSQDELVLAVSEGTVLFQEGVDVVGNGVLGTWVKEEVARRIPYELLEEIIAEEAQDVRKQDQQ